MKRFAFKTALCCATLLAGAAITARPSAAATVARAEAGRPVAFDVMMPLRNAATLEAFVAALHDPASPTYHKWLTPAQFGMRFGPESAKVAAVAASLRARGFDVTVQTRSLHVTGTAAQVETNFGTHLLLGRTPEGVTHVMQETPVRLPDEITATGAQVFSFSPHVAHVHSLRATGRIDPANRYSPTGTYWFDDLKEAYAYPAAGAPVTAADGTTQRFDGTGVTLGVLMSSDIFDADIAAVFDHENWRTIRGTPDPTLYARRYVNGGATTASPALDEASLDTQEELTGAPGAHVVLYDIPDLSDGNVAAGYITIDEYNEVDLVSSSFGGCELSYTAAYNGGQSFLGILRAQHELFLQGNAQGITFLASSGDNAGKECPNVTYADGLGNGTFDKGIEEPAADPAVTAVGGTNVVTGYDEGTLDSPYVGENGWSDPEIPYDYYGTGYTVSGGFWGAGGGISQVFAQPSYQTLVTTGSTTRRSTPDIGMQVGGCPLGIAVLDRKMTCSGGGIQKDGSGNTQRSAVVVSIGAGQTGGGFFGLIGTSVSSPELAGATALLIERQGRMGNLNTYIYTLAAQQAAGKGQYFHTGIPGFNGLKATDLSTTYGLTAGVGTPVVAHFVGAPADTRLSGTPQSPSNP